MFFWNLISAKPKINNVDKPFVSYFAYGSNMDLAQLTSRVGNPQHSHSTKLTGYKLMFNKFSVSRRCGAGNLVLTNNPEDIVEGIVYSLTEQQLAMLDRFEGYRTRIGTLSKNPIGYKKIDVTLDGGGKAITYIANVEAGLEKVRQLKNPKDVDLTENMLKPSIDYLSHFFKGSELGISNEYLVLLAQTEVLEEGTYQDYIERQSKGIVKI